MRRTAARYGHQVRAAQTAGFTHARFSRFFNIYGKVVTLCSRRAAPP